MELVIGAPTVIVVSPPEGFNMDNSAMKTIVVALVIALITFVGWRFAVPGKDLIGFFIAFGVFCAMGGLGAYTNRTKA